MSGFDTLRKNIAEAIKQMKSEGTVGCSLANLKQMTSTVGLSISVPAYHLAFSEIAPKVAKRLNFKLY